MVKRPLAVAVPLSALSLNKLTSAARYALGLGDTAAIGAIRTGHYFQDYIT